MATPSRQIGWGAEENLLAFISKQIEYLTGVAYAAGGMSASGILSLNALTDPNQTLVVGTSGTDFSIVSSGTTHTFNLPTASAANRGLLSSADWSNFDSKQSSLGFTPVNKAGDSMSGFLILNADPSNALGAATKQYVDNIASGINFHEPVHAATTLNLVANYTNGVSGVGAKLTATSPGALVVDTHPLTYLQRVLVWQQSDPIENGIYDLTVVGDGTTAWELTRSSDADNNPLGEIQYGDFTFVQQGATYGGFGFICNTVPPIIIGITPINYVQFNAAQVVTAGYGLQELTPNVISANTSILLEKNLAITGATKTKITYDANGLVTAGSDATTADIADSINKRYQTDLQQTYNDATSSIQTQLNAKQATLVSGTNIKTINGVSVVGSGDINTLGNSGNQLLTGGASWSGTGMVYNVTTLTYIIDGATYGPTTPANVTLSNGDPSFSRFDAIVVDVTGIPSVITGTPSSNPTTPTVSEDYVLIQYVLVGQAATTPTITNEYVYREGSSPDWTATVAAGAAPLLSASFVSTTPTPFQGLQCTLVTAPTYVSGKYISYTKPAGSILRSTYSFINFRVNLPVALPGRNILVYLYNGTTLIGTQYATNWGLNLTSANTWQLVSIPTSIFGKASETTITRVLFVLTGTALNTFSSGYDRYALDDIRFQSGYGPQSNTANITVAANDVTIGSTSKLNFIDGTNTNVVSTYDSLNNKVDVRVNAKGITQVTSVTLATASWSLVSGLWQYVYSNAAITATSIVDVIPANASIAIVKAADVLPATSSASGTVTLFATNAPSSTISVTVNIYN